jgi:hypothetical protein
VAPTVPLASSWGKVGHKYRSVITTLPSPCGPRRSIRIRARLLIIDLHLPAVRFRVLPKRDNLPPTHAERLLGIRMQAALKVGRWSVRRV